MSENFNLEIISPDQTLFNSEVRQAVIPAYEGTMTILKNHISIISFLRPGIVKIEKNDGNDESFFTQDGTVEFFNNNLILLSTFVENVKNLSKEFLNELKKKV